MLCIICIQVRITFQHARIPMSTCSRFIHCQIYLAIVMGEEEWGAAPRAGDRIRPDGTEMYRWGCCLSFPVDSGVKFLLPVHHRPELTSTWLPVLFIWGALGDPFGEVLRLMSEWPQGHLVTTKGQEQNPKPWGHGRGGTRKSGSWEGFGLAMEFETGGNPLSPGRMTKYQHQKEPPSSVCPYIWWALLSSTFTEISIAQRTLEAKTMAILLSPATERTREGWTINNFPLVSPCGQTLWGLSSEALWSKSYTCWNHRFHSCLYSKAWNSLNGNWAEEMLGSLKKWHALCFVTSLHKPSFWQCHTLRKSIRNQPNFLKHKEDIYPAMLKNN